MECIILLRYLPLAIAQIRFINSDGEWAQHGVRYLISPEPSGSPYRIGRWIPLSTSDLGSGWGGSEMWVRGQGAAVAKTIWFHDHFDWNIEVSWSGMTEGKKQDLDMWLKERAERHAARRKIEGEEYDAREAKHITRHKHFFQLMRSSGFSVRRTFGDRHVVKQGEHSTNTHIIVLSADYEVTGNKEDFMQIINEHYQFIDF